MYHIKINKTHIGIIFGLLMIVSFQNVYAIDYVDSTGYTPSWAYSLGQYQTLAKCLAIIEIDSLDGNWCFEWAAYTLDMENNSNIITKNILIYMQKFLLC